MDLDTFPPNLKNRLVKINTFDQDFFPKSLLSTDLDGITKSATFNFLAKESLRIFVLANQVQVDITTFEYGIPFYSPADQKC